MVQRMRPVMRGKRRRRESRGIVTIMACTSIIMFSPSSSFVVFGGMGFNVVVLHPPST